MIYNPFDLQRFNCQSCKKNSNAKDRVVLFPGSVDYLRYKPLKYLLNLSEKQNFKVIHVGRDDYNIQHSNLKSYKPVWDIERYYKQCDIVSGIFLGRTSIEGLLCGKRILQFDVDKKGDIKQVYWYTANNLQKFNKHMIVKQFLEESYDK